MNQNFIDSFFDRMERNRNQKVTNISLSKDVSDTYHNVDGLSLQNVFFTYNEYFPNCFMYGSDMRSMDNYFDTEGLFKELTENAPEGEVTTINYRTFNIDTNETMLGFCIVYNKKNIFARFERTVSECYILWGNNDLDALNELVEISKKYYRTPEPEKNNVFMIGTSSTGYMLIKSRVKDVDDFSVEKHYNDDFVKEDSKIDKFISDDNKSGLVILHGEKGTGKTTYIRHLINTHPEHKFVTVPANLINLLGEPGFGSFLMGLNNHIIILEDCENAIRDRRSTGGNSPVSLLLNLTDGLLSDDLGIKFICTFNEDIRNIDPALLRKGRLISKYEFKPLCVEKANTLIKEVMGEDKAIKTFSPMTLADIFNIEEDAYENKRTRII